MVLGVVSEVSAEAAELGAEMVTGTAVGLGEASFRYRVGKCGSHWRARDISANTSVNRSKGKGPGERDWSSRK